MWRRWILAVVLGLSCGGGGDVFRRGVAAHLRCPAGDVEIEQLSDDVRQAVGCGAAAVYRRTCSKRGGCVWHCLSCACNGVLEETGVHCAQ